MYTYRSLLPIAFAVKTTLNCGVEREKHKTWKTIRFVRVLFLVQRKYWYKKYFLTLKQSLDNDSATNSLYPLGNSLSVL